MGWLYMHRAGMGGFDTPKAYLDNQFTWERENEETGTFEGCRVIRSVSTTGAYYAAVQRYGPNNQTPHHHRGNLSGPLEPQGSRRPTVRLQGQCAVAALKWSISDDEVS